MAEGVRDWRVLEDGDRDKGLTYIQMFRDSPRIGNQVDLTAFDQPSDLCDTELLRFLHVWLGSRGSPHFVIRTMICVLCVLSGDYVRLDLIPRDIHAGLPLALMRELDQLPKKTPISHFE